MRSPDAGPATALSDGDDRLVLAAEPLASLQLRCGGDLPGRIAIPALLEAVRKARRYQLKLGRDIRAHNGSDVISVWAEVQPRPQGDAGCEIRLSNWRAHPLPAADERGDAARKASIDRQVAEFSAVLDGQQQILAYECDAPDLADLCVKLSAAGSRRWTEFVSVRGLSHHQPLHWRLLDGAGIAIEGSQREWRAALHPKWNGQSDPSGFELLFVSDEPAPRVADALPEEHTSTRKDLVIGAEVAPVLRQPIARIIANAETIRLRLAGPLADEYAAYASDIANAGELLLGLLDDLADLEVVEADDFATAPDRIDLATVARQAAGILGVRANEKAIIIDAPDTGVTLMAIAEFRRVLQILINLIGNAIRYSPENTAVQIELLNVGDRSRIVVADQGPGLSPAQAEVVFEKFERLGRSDDGGSGLGLYISRRLARAMGGELSVECTPGQGARFVLELPADKGDLAASQ